MMKFLIRIRQDIKILRLQQARPCVQAQGTKTEQGMHQTDQAEQNWRTWEPEAMECKTMRDKYTSWRRSASDIYDLATSLETGNKDKNIDWRQQENDKCVQVY